MILSWKKDGLYSSSYVESMKGVVYVATLSISLSELTLTVNIVKFIMLSPSGDFVLPRKTIAIGG